MFCPNCGRDCGEANFCSNCGARLKQKVNPEDRNPNNPFREEPLGEIPVGKYGGGTGFDTLTLEKDYLIVKHGTLFQRYEEKIPYELITAVRYIRSQPRKCGYLVVRWTKNKDLPIPTDRSIIVDKNVVAFVPLYDIIFYHIFYFLRSVAPVSANFSMDIGPYEMRKADDIYRHIELGSYFNRFNPFRDKAAWAMCQETGLDLRITKTFVAKSFDEYQQEMYARNPSASLRDLNMIIRNQALTRNGKTTIK